MYNEQRFDTQKPKGNHIFLFAVLCKKMLTFFKRPTAKRVALKAFQGNTNSKVLYFSDFGEIQEQIKYALAQASVPLVKITTAMFVSL